MQRVELSKKSYENLQKDNTIEKATNCALPQNFYTGELGKITAFYAVAKNQFSIYLSQNNLPKLFCKIAPTLSPYLTFDHTISKQ